MSKRSRFALAAVLASACMAVVAGSAHANRLELSAQTFRMTWQEVFRLREGGVTGECFVTLEGSFHSRTFAKVTSVLIGFLTRATMGTCRNATVRFLTETLPWHVQYTGFNGSLPNITFLLIQIIEASIFLRTGMFIGCLGRSSALHPFKMKIGRTPGETKLVTVNLIEEPIPYQVEFECTGLSMTPVVNGTGEFLGTGAERVRLFLI